MKTGCLCTQCRGVKNLCGRKICPVLLRYKTIKELNLEKVGDILQGSSPPALFVGRYGYPLVNVGPMIPPFEGDTKILDTPEKWKGKTLEEVVKLRMQLIRGSFRVRIDKASENNKLIEDLQLVAMSSNPVTSEAELRGRIIKRITFDPYSQPFGPIARVKRLEVEAKTDSRIEYVYYDRDLHAIEAMEYLYSRGLEVSAIQRVLSAGLMGIGNKRKFVPTRWSITAVDGNLSKSFISKILDNPSINEIEVYESRQMGNIFLVILAPGDWKYEMVEAWHPHTVWNPFRERIEIGGDYEDRMGRTDYAKIGGCYYAGRLATSEHLMRRGRQAQVLILREAREGYVLPVGVWVVRENVRRALKEKPYKPRNVGELFLYISERTRTPLKMWIRNSKILRDTLYQRRLSQYI